MSATFLSLNYPVFLESNTYTATELADQIYYHLYQDQLQQSGNQKQRMKVCRQLKHICLQELNPTEQTVFFSIICGKHQVKLAEELQISKYAVNRIYHRALEKVKRYAQYLEPFLR